MSSEELINILMVDDSPTNLVALESILHGPERNLVSVSSGDDALRYLLNNEVAVVLMDVYMPGIDGLETAALIRSREKYRNIPIIFLTADSTGGRHLSRGYSLGAVDYIVKPVDFQNFCGVTPHLRLEWVLKRPNRGDPTSPGTDERTHHG